MKKFIEISEEAYARLASGRCVEGSLHMDEWTGRVSFNAWQRKSRHRRDDKVVCQLEHGWLKESKQRYKFYNSVKKNLGGEDGENPPDDSTNSSAEPSNPQA